jgi:hypothetical protein
MGHDVDGGVIRLEGVDAREDFLFDGANEARLFGTLLGRGHHVDGC